MKTIHIMDTTLRDGEQTAGVAFTAEEKLTLAKALLLDTNVDSIEVASARVSSGEFEAASQIVSWAKEKNVLDRVEVLGFVDGGKSVDWIADAGCTVMNLLCKGSRKHLEKQLRKTPSQHIKEVNDVVSYAKEKGITVNVYLEDVSNGLKDSNAYVHQLVSGLKGVNRYMLPDTLGVWSPSETEKYCKELTKKYPKKVFDFHSHNDYDLAVANNLAAISAGVNRVHTTVNGMGERTGNGALASTVATIHDHSSFRTNVKEENLTNLSRLVESVSGVRIPSNKPIVGENVFTQTCGVHADGDKKGNLYHNKLEPERFGGVRAYALGKTSGKASVAKNLELLGIELDDEAMKKVLSRVVELGDKKETITLSDLPYIVSSVLGESVEQNVKLVDFSLSLGLKEQPQAKVTLEVEGNTYIEEAEGDGQYDAFMKAVKKIYASLKVKLPTLVDYSVRIPPGGKTDALVETVITWKNGKTFKTKGVDSDQTTAAIKATLNMLNRKGI